MVVVKGEPGCGKSTQVPQFVFDDYTSKMQGTSCKIVITQPRRISAISLAEYIAQERNERVRSSALMWFCLEILLFFIKLSILSLLFRKIG